MKIHSNGKDKIKLNIFNQAKTLDEAKKMAEQYFGCSLRFFQIDNSIFTAWAMRPKERVHVQEVWKFRIVLHKQSILLRNQ